VRTLGTANKLNEVYETERAVAEYKNPSSNYDSNALPTDANFTSPESALGPNSTGLQQKRIKGTTG